MDRGAFADLAFEGQAPAMPLDDVLHDRQAEARSAERAAAARVDAIEALRQPLEMFRRNAFAPIRHGKVNHLILEGRRELCTGVPAPPGSRFLIDGEPTDNRLALATRGALRLRLVASGRAAHSSFPELGDSAIDKLIDALVELRSIALPSDPDLGRTHYTIGLISGGVAPNVVSPAAEAEVMFRTVSDARTVRDALTPLESRVRIEHILEVPPVRMTAVAGFDNAVFPYTTDIPFLEAWGRPLLYGPGSIHVAHTADEFVEIAELEAAVDGYVALARHLLSAQA